MALKVAIDFLLLPTFRVDERAADLGIRVERVAAGIPDVGFTCALELIRVV